MGSAESPGSAYQARQPIYPRSVRGRFRRLKWGILGLAYGVYFLLPWLPWQRAAGPDQAVLFDIEGRRFYIFDLVVHPQDIFWLASLLAIAALALFFVTTVLGRVFCGYFCFQTLWTDVFLLIERLIQGERPARIRLDRAPWNREKILRKGATHLAWLLVAFATGLTFTLYWGEARQLLVQFFTGQAPFPAYATTLFLTATTYVMAGLAREQVCTYMCPYARFQSAMFDQDTLIVTYDRARGEGTAGRARLRRGARTREERHARGIGDCIDCGFCVQVCPTGIDIRDGLQIQCITCALCIDACDTIMDSLAWPRGLIRYDSERHLEGRGRTRFWRLKSVGYLVALVAVTAALVLNVRSQPDLELAVRQLRQPLFVVLSDGRIQNRYELKLNNLSERPVDLELELAGLPGAELDLGHIDHLKLAADDSIRVLARVRMAPDGAARTRPFRFVAHPAGRPDQPLAEVAADFALPGRRQ